MNIFANNDERHMVPSLTMELGNGRTSPKVCVCVCSRTRGTDKWTHVRKAEFHMTSVLTHRHLDFVAHSRAQIGLILPSTSDVCTLVRCTHATNTPICPERSEVSRVALWLWLRQMSRHCEASSPRRLALRKAVHFILRKPSLNMKTMPENSKNPGDGKNVDGKSNGGIQRTGDQRA